MGTKKIKFIFSQKRMTRKTLRRKVIDKFLKEKPGPAKDETYNRYEYLVEKTENGNIILKRPANLKLGFDYRIDVEGMLFKNGTNAPSHFEIFNDLKKKHKEDRNFAEEVRLGILRVLDMENPDDILQDISDKDIGLPVELILKISKWFAVEMDIRYWNGWGRNKYRLWLELMNLFEYRFKGNKTGYNFVKNRKKITEKRAIKMLMDKKGVTSIKQLFI